MEKIYQTIISLPDLQPSSLVNKVFNDLVTKATQQTTKHNLNGGQVTKLRKLCSSAEYELEKETALKVISSTAPQHSLENFMYYRNYIDLVALEFANVSAIKKISKVLFVGGGPLPLTAIILAQKYNISCTIIDNNKEAVTISKKLIQSLSLTHMINVECCDARRFPFYGKWDCIYVASLVGSTRKEKKELLSFIYDTMSLSSLLICRSANLNRKLLYPEIKYNDLPVFPILDVRPLNHIVNSFLVLQK